MKIVNFVLIMVVALLSITMFGCDHDDGNSERYWTKVTLVEEKVFTPSKKIKVYFPPGHGHGHTSHGQGHGHGHSHHGHWHFVMVLDQCDIDEIISKLSSDDDWRVLGQESDGSEDFCVVDQFIFKIGGFTIDIRETVTLQRFETKKVRKERYYYVPNPNGDPEDPATWGHWEQYPDWEPRS